MKTTLTLRISGVNLLQDSATFKEQESDLFLQNSLRQMARIENGKCNNGRIKAVILVQRLRNNNRTQMVSKLVGRCASADERWGGGGRTR